MKVVFVPNCLQISKHRRNGERLLKFFDLIESLVEEVEIEYPNRKLNESDLQDCNLLISTTRKKYFPYDCDEKNLITDYVRLGGSILIMSNHPTRPLNTSITRRDSELSQELGFRFQDIEFAPKNGEESIFKTSTHRIMSHSEDTNRGIEVVVNNCSCIKPVEDCGTPVLQIDREKCDITSFEPNLANEPIFAIAIDGGENKELGENHGRIIGISDSGIIGKPKLPENPGPGLCEGDNYYFMQNVLKWLLDI